MFIILAVIVILVASLIFWSDFRHWLVRQINALIIVSPLWLRPFLRRLLTVVRWYAISIVVAAIVTLLTLVVGIFFEVPEMIGAGFLLAIIIVYLVVFFPSLLLRIFGCTNNVFPKPLRVATAWLAFFGFLGMLHPDILSFKFLVAACLIGFISLGIVAKTKFLDSVIYPVVVIMCLIVIWKYAAPDGFRAVTGQVDARGEQANSILDRSSIETKADASVTYARPIKDIKAVYVFTFNKESGKIESLERIVKVSIKQDSVIRVFNHKNRVQIFEGQGFTEVQLGNGVGGYLGGKRCWVEADYLKLYSPGDLAEERRAAIEQKQRAATVIQPQVQFQPTASTKPTVYEAVGTYTIAAGNQESDWITVANCRHFNFTHYNFEIVYKDGTSKEVWKEKSLPAIATFKVINRSNEPVGLLVKV